jgi:hypothetical protein
MEEFLKMKKMLIVVVVALCFGLPFMSYAQGFSQFNSTPIQSNPQMGQGDRYVGNTTVQIVAPSASNTKIEGERAVPLPVQKTPETVFIPSGVPYQIQQSKPQ